MLEVIVYPNPILRKVSAPVEAVDDELKRFAEKMIETMYAQDGVGLAAPQVGRNIRLFVIDVSRDPENRHPEVLINPRFLSRGKEKETVEEGCLSVPDITANVTRPTAVKVEATNLAGETVVYEGDCLLARALQHEYDHLDGILFIDKVSMATKLSLKGELKVLEETYKRTVGA